MTGAKLCGLPPIAAPHARVLILGSFPSQASLQHRQYYAHPQNHFWRIVEQLFGIARAESYSRRCRRLTERGLAVWDVLESCEREGSSDGKIRNPQANDFAAFYRDHPDITHVFFNGAAAEAQYAKLVLPHADDEHPQNFLRLPSTSPANAAIPPAEKLLRWRAVA